MPINPNSMMEILELATLRRRVPLTQGELAAAAGVSVGTVRGIERNAYATVRPRVIRALAAALGTDPAAVAEFRVSLGLPLPSSSPAQLPETNVNASVGRSGG
jgi:transcriptional regulator with XRE-family HTH domain